MTRDEFDAAWDKLEADYIESYGLTQHQSDKAADNVETFGYPEDEMSQRVLDAWSACLCGESHP